MDARKKVTRVPGHFSRHGPALNKTFLGDRVIFQITDHDGFGRAPVTGSLFHWNLRGNDAVIWKNDPVPTNPEI